MPCLPESLGGVPRGSGKYPRTLSAMCLSKKGMTGMLSESGEGSPARNGPEGVKELSQAGVTGPGFLPLGAWEEGYGHHMASSGKEPPKLPVTTGSGGLTPALLPTCLLLGPREPKQLRVPDWADLSDPTFPRD